MVQAGDDDVFQVKTEERGREILKGFEGREVWYTITEKQVESVMGFNSKRNQFMNSIQL